MAEAAPGGCAQGKCVVDALLTLARMTAGTRINKILLQTLAILAVAFEPNLLAGFEDRTDRSHWYSSLSEQQRRAICGVHSLYMLLVLHGQKVDYEEVFGAVDVGPRGVSMLQLQEAAKQLGLTVLARRCEVKDLPRCELPLIAHTNTGQYVGGHYIVLLTVGRDRASYIDGTTGDIVGVRAEYLESILTGYILEVQERSWYGCVNISVIAVSLFLAVAWWCRSMRHRRRGRCWFRGVFVSVLSTAAVAAGGVPQEGLVGQKTQETKVWRVAENDGVNCLYLYLTLHDRHVEYDTIETTLDRGLNKRNMRGLRDAACSLGPPSDVFSCRSVDELKARLPGIVALADERGGSQGFYLVANVDGQRVWVVNGGNVTYARLSTDDFLRGWTGHVLAAHPEDCRGEHRHRTTAISWVGGCAVLVGYIVFRVWGVTCRQPLSTLSPW